MASEVISSFWVTFPGVCPPSSAEERRLGLTLACQYMPIAKPLQKTGEAPLMNCASGSLSLHSIFLQGFTAGL